MFGYIPRATSSLIKSAIHNVVRYGSAIVYATPFRTVGVSSDQTDLINSGSAVLATNGRDCFEYTLTMQERLTLETADSALDIARGINAGHIRSGLSKLMSDDQKVQDIMYRTSNGIRGSIRQKADFAQQVSRHAYQEIKDQLEMGLASGMYVDIEQRQLTRRILDYSFHSDKMTELYQIAERAARSLDQPFADRNYAQYLMELLSPHITEQTGPIEVVDFNTIPQPESSFTQRATLGRRATVSSLADDVEGLDLEVSVLSSDFELAFQKAA